MVARSLAVATSHSLITPGLTSLTVPLTEARVLPSEANRTHVIEFACAGRVRARSFPVVTSQKITELGVTSMRPPPLPVAGVLPSGEKARDHAQPSLPNFSSSFSFPVSTSQSFTGPVAEEARVLPSGENA